MDFLTCDIPEEVTHIITNPPFCYDGETEVLTNEGWLNISLVNKNHKIMSMEPYSKNIEYVEIEDIVKQPYKGDMYNVKSKYFDLMITPNHRMVVYNKHGNPKINKKTNDLYYIKDLKGDNYYPLEGYTWKGEEIEYFEIEEMSIEIKHKNNNTYLKKFPKKSIKMDYWLSFLGLWLADGHCRGTNGGEKRYDVGIKQHIKTSDKVREILDNLGYGYKEYINKKTQSINFNIFNPQLYNYLFDLGNSKQKYIPSMFKKLSSRQINILLESYIFGDSSASRNGLRLSTMSKKLADDLSECFLKIGNIVSFKPYEVRARGKDYGTIFNARFNKEGNNVFARVLKNTIHKVDNFNGFVYGINLKKNFTMLVRRNGKICFSGNSKKNEFLKRCYEIGKPFALLLPIQTLDTKQRFELYKQHGLQIILFDRRVSYIGSNGSPPFASCWISNKILPNEINYEVLPK